MVWFIKSVTFDRREPLTVAAFWAAVRGSDVDEESTAERAFVEPPGWGGASLWFVRVPEPKRRSRRTCNDVAARAVAAARKARGPRHSAESVNADDAGAGLTVRLRWRAR